MRNSIAFKRTKRFLNIRRKKESAVPHHNEMSNRNILKGFSNECEAVKLQAQPSSMFSLSRLTRWKFNRYMFHVTRWLQSNTQKRRSWKCHCASVMTDELLIDFHSDFASRKNVEWNEYKLLRKLRRQSRFQARDKLFTTIDAKMKKNSTMNVKRKSIGTI